MATIELTNRQIMLARVALIQRCARLKGRVEPLMEESYKDSIELLQLLWDAREKRD